MSQYLGEIKLLLKQKCQKQYAQGIEWNITRSAAEGRWNDSPTRRVRPKKYLYF